MHCVNFMLKCNFRFLISCWNIIILYSLSGVIVTDTALEITDIPKGALVEGFPSQQVSIQLDVTSNSSGADATGDRLWKLYVYTSNGTNGTGSGRVIEQYSTTETWIDTNLLAGNTMQLDVNLFIDMTSLLCDGVSRN